MAGAVAKASRYSEVAEAKSEGVTYTPRALAVFVASEMLKSASLPIGRVARILDPAVGHGELLVALLERINCPAEVHGYETDGPALVEARTRLCARFPNVSLHLHHGSAPRACRG